ncbi:MAG: hypothetical protein HC915_04350 [Anaerolineae bacterium]|nr:hypothetical protein [Anaerolineae bacterium]
MAYEGTRYAGFQRQANAHTIQAALEGALEKVTQAPTRVLGAGRTDAGVHASGQVIAFDAAWRHPVEALWRATNAMLRRTSRSKACARRRQTFTRAMMRTAGLTCIGCTRRARGTHCKIALRGTLAPSAGPGCGGVLYRIAGWHPRLCHVWAAHTG